MKCTESVLFLAKERILRHRQIQIVESDVSVGKDGCSGYG